MADDGSGVMRLSLAEIARIDTELDALAAESAFELKPGVLSANGVAVAGLDGLLFIADGANRWERQYRGELTVAPAWIEGWLRVLRARRDEAARRGVALWNVIVPEKQVVLPERRWPAPLPDGSRRPARLLMAADGEGLIHYAGDALAAAKTLAPAYFRRNSHWTPSGCCAAVLGLLAAMGAAPGGDVRFAYRRYETSHDLPPHFFRSPPLETAGMIEPAGEIVFAHRPFEASGRHTGSRYGIRNPDAPDARRVAVFGDSFAYDAGFAAALSALFRDVLFFWSKDVAWDEVERHAPDIVIWESAERFLATLPRA